MSPTDTQLDMEFAHTAWRAACGAEGGIALEALMVEPLIVTCRRPAGHVGEHATGFGERRRRWGA